MKRINKIVLLCAGMFSFIFSISCSSPENDKIIVEKNITNTVVEVAAGKSLPRKSNRSLYKENGKVYFEITNLYAPSDDGSVEVYCEIPVAFLADENGNKIADMPYLADKNIFILDYKYNRTNNYKKDGTIILERTDGILTKGAKMIIEPDKSTVTFSSFDRFFLSPNKTIDLDRIALTSYIKVHEESSNTKKGKDTKICFSDYDIDIIYDLDENGEAVVFFPLQIINCFNSYTLYPIIYNGYGLYCGFPANPASPDKNYVINESKFKDKEKSADLKKFVLNEMIFSMDTFYGLKDTHNITDFKSFYDTTGLTELLKGDAKDTVQAAYDLTLRYLDDGHSAPISKYTPFLSDKAVVTENQGQTRTTLIALRESYINAREGALGKLGTENFKAYKEITTNIKKADGTTEDITTAYLTFDDFSAPTEKYKELILTNPPSDSSNIDLYMNDTFGLVIYANAQINRENSPVKNVVIDVSTNGGGTVDAMIFISTWILNKKNPDYIMKMSIRNQMNGAEATVGYLSDVNQDGEFNEKDELSKDVNVYILTGPFSFSCGTVFPSIMKASKKVSLIGKKTGGGSCIIRQRTMADGVWFCTSGSYRSSVNINGSYYDIDKGVDPDYPLDSIESFYDRGNLNKYLYKIQNPWL